MSGSRGALAVVAEGGVVVGVGGAEAAGELVFVGAQPERAAQPGGGDARRPWPTPTPVRWRGDLVGVGVQSFAEEGFHLFFA